MQDNERRAELIAAAVADDTTAAERAELDALSAQDPTVAEEIRELRRVADRLFDARASSFDPVQSLDPLSLDPLKQRILDATASDTVPTLPRPRSRTPYIAAIAAAFGLLAGAGAVLVSQSLTSNTITGPPGTLGAFEQVQFTDEPSGVVVEGGLVAHTWGTETVLDMTGLPQSGRYTVMLVDGAGEKLSSGTFLGSAVPITCRMNAALLRTDVSGLEIRNSDGAVVATATVPAA